MARRFSFKDVAVTTGRRLFAPMQNEGHDRSWCDKCGGHVLIDHRDTYGIVDVYAAVIEG